MIMPGIDTPFVIPRNAVTRNPFPLKAETFFRITAEWELGDTQGERLACGSTRHPVAVPGVRLADGAAALHTDRGHSLRSLHPPPAALPSLPIAGPVIVYGVSASVVYGFIYWITTLF